MQLLKTRPAEAAAPAPEPVAPEPEPENGWVGARHYRPWTAEDDVKLEEYRRDDVPDDIIGLAIGRTTTAVQARISVLKARGDSDAIPSLKRPSQWTPERVAEARALRAEGLTTHQIARRLGTNATTVGRVLRSPETNEDGSGEGVRTRRTVPDLARAESDVEQARAALARAEARHREAMEPLLVAVRNGIRRAGLTPSSGGEGDPAQLLLASLRSHGIELRVRT